MIIVKWPGFVAKLKGDGTWDVESGDPNAIPFVAGVRAALNDEFGLRWIPEGIEHVPFPRETKAQAVAERYAGEIAYRTGDDDRPFEYEEGTVY